MTDETGENASQSKPRWVEEDGTIKDLCDFCGTVSIVSVAFTGDR
ncbi:MAG: hypothetical protein U5J64_02730 [Halobacteriales archaeon]|nr:hypothetical protein [Halobacteriales archaeon]